MNGLNCNWISAASKRDYLRQLRNSFDEQYWYCKEDSSKVEKLVAIDNSYQERLEERLRLPLNSLIYDSNPFPEEERVLIGNRYAVGYRLLEIAEKMLPKGKSVLWLCQEFPTLAAPEYPLRIAQLESALRFYRAISQFLETVEGISNFSQREIKVRGSI